jgi:hypothetical protein
MCDEFKNLWVVVYLTPAFSNSVGFLHHFILNCDLQLRIFQTQLHAGSDFLFTSWNYGTYLRTRNVCFVAVMTSPISLLWLASRHEKLLLFLHNWINDTVAKLWYTARIFRAIRGVVAGSCFGLICCNISSFTSKDCGNIRKNSLRIFNVPAEIRAGHFWSASKKRCYMRNIKTKLLRL